MYYSTPFILNYIVWIGYNMNLKQSSVKQPLQGQSPAIQPPTRQRYPRSDSEGSLDNNTIDMMRIANRQQQLRISQIKVAAGANPNANPTHDRAIRHSDYPSNWNSRQRQRQLQMRERELGLGQYRDTQMNPYDKYSTLANPQHHMAVQHYPSEEYDSFLAQSQNTASMGVLLLVIFIVLLPSELFAAVWILGNTIMDMEIAMVNAMFLLKISQVIWEGFQRWKKRNKAIQQIKALMKGGSLTNNNCNSPLLQSSGNNISQQKSKMNLRKVVKNPLFYLFSTLVLQILILLNTCLLLTDSILPYLLAGDNIFGYLSVSALYFCIFVFPQISIYLLSGNNQYLTIILILVIPAIAAVESWMLSCIIVLKVAYKFIQSAQDFNTANIEYLIKVITAVLISLYWGYIMIGAGAGYYYVVSDSMTSYLVGSALAVGIITFSMFVSRSLCLRTLNHQLRKYFYTQTHIYLAMILSNVIVCVLNVDWASLELNTLGEDCIIVAGCILAGCLVWWKSRQDMIVQLDTQFQDIKI